ncbi:unnamed protein product [Mytilus coruscus]|uniref:Uncharacterized protein n=1 Tax=Mytilus coruscus TaxID=42192 RepID=A0A6J8CGK8_MYTCO|nr:unnamed protein product [Mytilus coruscus]
MSKVEASVLSKFSAALQCSETSVEKQQCTTANLKKGNQRAEARKENRIQKTGKNTPAPWRLDRSSVKIADQRAMSLVYATGYDYQPRPAFFKAMDNEDYARKTSGTKFGEVYQRTPASILTEMSDMLRKDRPRNGNKKLTNKVQVTSEPSQKQVCTRLATMIK